MAYTLDTLVSDCRVALAEGGNGLAGVKSAVERALADTAFLSDHITCHAPPPERLVIHEEPKGGFCVCVHVYDGAKIGDPHDHGPTWAVYGQAEGETEMTDWEIVSPAEGDAPATVRKTKTYRLIPGQAHCYPIGAVHAPIRTAPTRLLRIEGTDTAKITRSKIVPLDA